MQAIREGSTTPYIPEGGPNALGELVRGTPPRDIPCIDSPEVQHYLLSDPDAVLRLCAAGRLATTIKTILVAEGAITELNLSEILIEPDQLRELLRLIPQLPWLKLPATDAHLKVIAEEGSNLTKLTVADGTLTDAGLHHVARLPNLTFFCCTSCPNITNISPLATLPLTHLTAADTNIADFSAFRATRTLTHLYLQESGIDAIGWMRELPVVALNLSNTVVKDLRPLTGKDTLRELFIIGCEHIADRGFLEGLNLMRLEE